HLRSLNERAWAGEPNLLPLNPTLDSSLKRNTTFIKRLRTGISSTPAATFLSDIRALSLHKYLSEIIAAAYEGFCRCKVPSSASSSTAATNASAGVATTAAATATAAAGAPPPAAPPVDSGAAPNEISTAVEIASALHQRFGPHEFTCALAWHLARGLMMPDRAALRDLSQDVRDRDERDRVARHRVLLRLVTELWLVGVLRTMDDAEKPDDAKDGGVGGESAGRGAAAGVASSVDYLPTAGLRRAPATTTTTAATSSSSSTTTDPFPLEVLKELLGHDTQDCSNLPLAVSFVRTYAFDILGIRRGPRVEKKGRREGHASARAGVGVASASTSDDDGEGDGDATADEPEEAPLASERSQQRFRALFTKYVEKLKIHAQKSQKNLAAQSRRNEEAYVKSGEIFEDRQANFERQSKVHEKLVANLTILCDVMGIEMPRLEEKESADPFLSSAIGVVKTQEYLRGSQGEGQGAGIWEDEDERRFYENLADLKGKVPSILLDSGKKKTEKDGSPAPKLEESTLAIASAPEATATATSADDTSASASLVNKTVGAQVEALLAKLPDLQTKDQVDQFALSFCFLNSKASRNRLLRALQDVPRGRFDLLPLYARLVATLGQYLPDIVQGMVQHLDDEYRSLQRRKSKEFLGQVRLANIRYLAELIKFGLVPEHVIFHCFRVSLDDFSRVNIEIIANYLENCGRYLLRNPQTTARMAAFLETLARKKTAQHLPQQERMLLENAMYFVDPPRRPAIQQKERTPVELYVRKLVYLDLNKRNHSRVLKLLRQLHWEESEIVEILERVFARPGKIKYGHVHLLVLLLSSLQRYHQEFVVGIIDTVLENITLGLELNDFKFNQRRVAEVKYLGEMYNHKLVDSKLIFVTLYHITTFAHPGGNPTPGVICPLDLPDDFFRARLVCTLIDTCGTALDRGSLRQKLDFFLTFFQYYLLCKEPMPADIEFMVLDTLAVVRPKWKLVLNLPEAARLLREAIMTNYQEEVLQEQQARQQQLKSQQQQTAVIDQNGDAGLAEDSEDDEDDDDGDDDDDDDVSDDEMAQGQDGDAVTATAGDDPEITAEGPAADQSPAVPISDDEDEDDDDDDDDDEEDTIYIKRQAETVDPIEEAEFDQAFERMVAESLDSRKSERKAIFDVPLPMKRQAGGGTGTPGTPTSAPSGTSAGGILSSREVAAAAALDEPSAAATSESGKTAKANQPRPGMMAFSLMTKKGNRQRVSHALVRLSCVHPCRRPTNLLQTRTIDLPSDSSFALALKNQQAAEREEQQRIKNLVLKMDLHSEEAAPPGEYDPSCWPPLQHPSNPQHNKLHGSAPPSGLSVGAGSPRRNRHCGSDSHAWTWSCSFAATTASMASSAQAVAATRAGPRSCAGPDTIAPGSSLAMFLASGNPNRTGRNRCPRSKWRATRD
ncbi:hypothetical protein KEM52_005734, partial [Ascosphaera acerosa]